MSKAFLLSALLLLSAHSLYFGITAKPFCFDIDAEPGKTIKFFYEVTGEKPEEATVDIVNQQQSIVASFTGANNFTELSG